MLHLDLAIFVTLVLALTRTQARVCCGGCMVVNQFWSCVVMVVHMLHDTHLSLK